MTNNTTVLTCVACGQECEHELIMVGRLLSSTRCSNCSYELHHEQRDLMSAYLHDLEHRVVTKPTRWVRRALRDPVTVARSLPGDLLRQPGKFVDEFRTVLRRR